ncbi:VWA-like domain-containing protein [Clostridium algoriphilum]|uniref:vWA domain-containing protein n=1 Tax=Clostridium algoriphilum TaxID=198347 RepID=UPI001CF47435|nr:VWA-like domain-containing protein [Clostridium algoriphilum]MCB2293451.1 VWA-like domain-containing protein [Clostridium algoriphilum]
MGKNFESLKNSLYDEISNVVSIKNMPTNFKEDFMQLVSMVNFMLIEDNENFYGYFLLQMSREIKYDISAPTAVNFKLSRYVIYFNPYIFLNLSGDQMKSTIKHEIYHILSSHLNRARGLKTKYSTLAINMAMDIVVNQYLNYLPPYATTIDSINFKYSLKLQPYMSMESYAAEIQESLNLLEEDENEEDDSKEKHIEKEYDVSKTHDLWEESIEGDEETLKNFTKKFAALSEKGKVPLYLEKTLKGLKGNKGEIPWNLYLKKIMGTLESDKKKTVARRSRRQPNRLDLRGELRGHTARITLAIDISGSISDEEFQGAIKEVFNIVKTYKHEITLIECDTEIRQVYKVKSINSVRERCNSRGGTKFEPVFKYVNNTDTNILIYFTDGKGEEELDVMPKGYKTLWVISGRGDKLSLKEPFGIVKKLKPVEIKEDTQERLDVMVDGFSMNSQEPIY